MVQGLLGYFTGITERKQELLLQTYQALIEATASLAAGEDRVDGLRNLIAAKQRVLYFAPTDVVHALADFGRTSEKFTDPGAVAAFAQLLRTMRASLNLPAVDDNDFLRVLVGRDQLSPLPQRGMESPGGSRVDASPQAPSS